MKTLYFLQRVPNLFTEDDKQTQALRMLKTIEPQIPVYHTRAMRREFGKNLHCVQGAKLPEHLLRHIYRTLTGDSTAIKQCKEIDQRVQLAIETEDPDLVVDLRKLNLGRPGDTFKAFFDELQRQVEAMTAADERRHGVCHMSTYLSIRDLREQVAKKLPEGTAIPSESTIIFAFAPSNLYTRAAQHYTGKIDLKFCIQRRQLRAFHPDAHYCNALYKYMRAMAVEKRESALFLSCDDKAKVRNTFLLYL